MAGGKNSGRAAVVNRLCEFLVVATHAILYVHEVYPQRIFEMRQKYGVATFYSKHPDVNDYIAKVISGMRDWFLEDSVESVAVVIFAKDTVHARYVFDVSILASDDDVTAMSLAELDNQLRAHLCRLLSRETPDPGRDRVRDETGGERRFEYVVNTKGVRTGRDWMPADGSERRELEGEVAVLPVKDADRFATTLQLASRVEVDGEALQGG